MLYIDDLDRCPPDRVVALLEAVHLLLAVPLFVVVVAVDPRWLLRAIAVHYREVLAPAAVTTADLGTAAADVDPDEDGHWASTPAQYLEKIFQVVFTLPPITTPGYATLLHDLVGQGVDSSTAATVLSAVDEPDMGAALPADLPDTVGADADADADDGNSAIELPAARVVSRVDPFAFEVDELKLMGLLGPPLITTPRSVKRLANSYGLLSTLHRLGPDSTAPATPADLAVLMPPPAVPRHPGMVLLAALVGFPHLGSVLLKHLYRTAEGDRPPSWSAFLEGLDPWFDECWRNKADRRLTAIEAESWHTLAAALVKVTDEAHKAGVPLPQDLWAWAQWVVAVGRLSFPAGRIVTGLLRHPGGLTPQPSPSGQPSEKA